MHHTVTHCPGGGGLGGYSHILSIQVCATVQDMVFKPFCQEQGIENMHFRSGTGCQSYCKGPILKQMLFKLKYSNV